MRLAHRLGAQLRCPRGLAGRWLGHVMTLVNERANRITIDSLDVRPADDVLELGFGPGRAIARLAALAPAGRVCGIDQSPVMLELASRRNAAAILGGRVDLRQADFAALPFADASFDRVVGINVVYFWSRPGAIMREIGRITRPGARIALYATHRRSMEKWPFADGGSHILYDEEGLRDLFTGAGCEVAPLEVRSFAAGFGVTGLCAVATRNP